MSKPIVTTDVRHDTSRPLREIAPILTTGEREEAPENPYGYVQARERFARNLRLHRMRAGLSRGCAGRYDFWGYFCSHD